VYPEFTIRGKAAKYNFAVQTKQMQSQPTKSRRLLNPIERISEILFGLIMALTFTCTISVAQAGSAEIRSTLFAALGCNIAWGLVDAVMYILTTLAERGRNKNLLHFVRTTKNVETARTFIADALPPVIASVTDDEKLESIRKSLLEVPESVLRVKLTMEDFKIAFALFLLVFLSTFPVVIPFLLAEEPQLALRISNLVAVVMMFICGWLLAQYGGYNKILSSLTMTILGVGLVALTILLGG
jgi:VIT1/CCC1 family predicted Fe2+/Mn2+ transporter